MLIQYKEKEYSEKVTCKQCQHTVYRNAEIYNIYKTDTNTDTNELYGIFVKKFQCPKCGSTEFTSSLIEGSVPISSSTQEIINFEPKVHRKRNTVEKKIKAKKNDTNEAFIDEKIISNQNVTV